MDQPVVTVEGGQLKGKCGTDYLGRQYLSFQGIPYAKPPIGELRFKAPVPPEPWIGIRDATKEGERCYSRDLLLSNIGGSEDCLFLNVYTHELPINSNAAKPVMVWVHGGGFVFGSGNTDMFGPEFLLSEDIVLVTINYRLGLLGFLNFNDESLGIHGNAGLKDQVLALKWVQKNISQFGGNPNNVTIFGESAGAAAVHLLVLSPTTKGLFHRAIIQSGCAICHWVKGQPSAAVLAETLKLESADEEKILKILQNTSVEKLYDIQEQIEDMLIASKVRPFCVVVEKQKENAFLPEEPVDIITSGKYNKVPLIIGYTSREGMLENLLKKFNMLKCFTSENFAEEIPHMFNLSEDTETKNIIGKKIKKFYFNDKYPTEDDLESQYLFHTDNMFFRETYKMVKLHTETSTTPIYLYRVSVESSLNVFKNMLGIKHKGVAHGDDLAYLFKSSTTPVINPGSIEDVSIRRFAKLWCTFARYGDPNPVKPDSLIGVKWKPVEKENLHFLDIGEDLTVGSNPESERIAFWEEISNLYCNK